MFRQAFFIIIFAVFVSFPGFSSESMAQEPDWQEDERAAKSEIADDEEEAAREMDKHVFGKVIEVNAAARVITVVSNDYEDEEMGVAHRYVAWSDTEFTNISSLSDIKEGDNVDIDYYIFEGERVIESIVKN